MPKLLSRKFPFGLAQNNNAALSMFDGAKDFDHHQTVNNTLT